MFKRKRKRHPQIVVSNTGLMPDNTPIEEMHLAFINHETALGVLDPSTIQAHKTRLIGINGTAPASIACDKSGVRVFGDLKKTSSFRRINKNIDMISTTRAQANNIKSSFKKSVACNVELGNIILPPGVHKGIRQQKNRPCAPKQLSDEQIDYFRKSKKGRTPFLAARNDLVGEVELLYAIRPGQEITNINDDNVHPLEGYMDILRDDGLMQRIYLRRDTCDHIIKYRALRADILKAAGETEIVKPFFIKERNV